ncbi:TetR/AcrR family transcriptional regulator [Nocardia brasiliensis]|nr:TetR/AcrR family transcriptional regulator [Nocardia brasiliensis]
MAVEDTVARHLVRAGVKILMTHPSALLDGGLRIEEVIDIANSSNATFYRKFATKQRYLNEVSRAMADFHVPSSEQAHQAIETAISESGGDARNAIRSLVASIFLQLPDHTATQRLMFALLKERIGLAPGDYYAKTDAVILEAFELLFARHGATLRKPLTTSSFTVMITAIFDGFILRHRVDPAAVSTELIAGTLLAVLNIAIDFQQRHEHIDDALHRLDSTRIEVGELPSDPRNALITAAQTEFRKRGYFLASLEGIAATARVPTGAARRLFPTKTHVIVSALQPQFERLGAAVADDYAIGYDDAAILVRHLTRFAVLVSEERSFMDALRVAATHDTDAEPDGLISVKQELDFPALIIPMIEGGQAAGSFNDEQSAEDIAVTLSNALLLHCLTHPNADPVENAEFISTVFLGGLRRR